MRKFFWTLLVAAAAAAARAQSGSILREDGFWVETVTTEYAVGGATRAL